LGVCIGWVLCYHKLQPEIESALYETERLNAELGDQRVKAYYADKRAQASDSNVLDVKEDLRTLLDSLPDVGDLANLPAYSYKLKDPIAVKFAGVEYMFDGFLLPSRGLVYSLHRVIDKKKGKKAHYIYGLDRCIIEPSGGQKPDTHSEELFDSELISFLTLLLQNSGTADSKVIGQAFKECFGEVIDTASRKIGYNDPDLITLSVINRILHS